jgi:hypothetical protein
VRAALVQLYVLIRNVFCILLCSACLSQRQAACTCANCLCMHQLPVHACLDSVNGKFMHDQKYSMCWMYPQALSDMRQQYKNYIFIYASVHICPQFLLRHHLPSPCNINHLSTTIPNPTYLGLIPDPSTRVHCLCSTLITFIMSIRQSLLHMPTAGEWRVSENLCIYVVCRRVWPHLCMHELV